MNAQQLKNAILQEAIEGRLVPQDPNDEPASALLARIRKEKEQLVKEGKLKKKDLVETPISEDEIPFEIPENWEWCRLGNVGLFERGNGIKRDETFESGYPCVRYGEMYTKYKYAPTFEKTVSFTSKSVFEKCRKARKGDLFMALTGENKQDISLATQYVGDEEIAVGGDLCHFSILEAYGLYFVYLINSTYFSSKKEILATGDIIVHISTDKLASIPIPLPPLAEQHRIVAKIEELLPKVDKYGKAQDTLNKLNAELPERLKKSILQEAIEGRLVPQNPNDEPASVLLAKIRKEKEQLVKEGKLKKKDLEVKPISEDEIPFEIPDTWEWVRVKDVFIINPKVIAEDDADAAFIPMEKIVACYGSKYSYEIRKWKDIKPSFTSFADGDVAFAKITPCFQNRKSMILENLPNGIGAGTTELKVLRQYSETMDRKYLLYFLASSYFVDEAVFKGTANQQRIIVGYLENKLFPLPPLAEQHRIVAKLEQVLSEIDKLKK